MTRINAEGYDLDDPAQREAAWRSGGGLDYLALAAKNTAGYAKTYGGPGYGRQPDAGGGGGGGGGAGDWGIPTSWQRRMELLGYTPVPGKDRLSRSLASLFTNVPAVRELAINATDFPATDYQTATQRYLAGLGEPGKDPIQYAVDQGFMPKMPARTIAEMVDARTLAIMNAQGLVSAESQTGINKQLEAQYQAELTGTELPKPDINANASLQLPTPSTQFWNRLFQPEQQGLTMLAEALGTTEADLARRIALLGPPGGGSNLANLVFRSA